MKKVSKFVWLSALLFSVSSHAGLIDLAPKVGFTGCDSAIKEEFKEYLTDATGRVSSNYFEKNRKIFSLTATWGEVGDSIFQKTIFEKNDQICYAYRITVITLKESCMSFKEANPVWKYVDSSGDYVWTKNAGGVDAIMQSPPYGGCNIFYNISKKYPAD